MELDLASCISTDLVIALARESTGLPANLRHRRLFVALADDNAFCASVHLDAFTPIIPD
nr:MetaGeneMark_Unknown Function [uncultured bacterium]